MKKGFRSEKEGTKRGRIAATVRAGAAEKGGNKRPRRRTSGSADERLRERKRVVKLRLGYAKLGERR